MSTKIAELSTLCKEGRLALYLGAGASIPSTLPTWNQLISNLVDKASETVGIPKESIADYRQLLDQPEKKLLLASLLKDDLGDDYFSFIEETFANEDLEPSEIHKLAIDIPFEFYVTTNYDNLLEKAFREKHLGKRDLPAVTYDEPSKAASLLHRNKQFVLKAHGDAQLDPRKSILTESDYRHIIHHQPGYRSILQTLLTTYSILYVGSSFTDPELMLLLGFIHSSFHGATPTHYALNFNGERNTAECRQFIREFRIEFIDIEGDDIGASANQFLRELKDSIQDGD